MANRCQAPATTRPAGVEIAPITMVHGLKISEIDRAFDRRKSEQSDVTVYFWARWQAC